jgi:CRISPR/Cas system Type II protein with McrA/HNH and RuvC-like nuclease domain
VKEIIEKKKEWDRKYYFRYKLHAFFKDYPEKRNKEIKQPKKQRRIKEIIEGKLEFYLNPTSTFRKGMKQEMKVTEEMLKQVYKKLGPNPVCYLTGDKIDVKDAKSYNLDHIIPRAQGGDNSIDNLGILTKQANMAKSEYTMEEHIEYCKKVLIHQGYRIEKI